MFVSVGRETSSEFYFVPSSIFTDLSYFINYENYLLNLQSTKQIEMKRPLSVSLYLFFLCYFTHSIDFLLCTLVSLALLPFLVSCPLILPQQNIISHPLPHTPVNTHTHTPQHLTGTGMLHTFPHVRTHLVTDTYQNILKVHVYNHHTCFYLGQRGRCGTDKLRLAIFRSPLLSLLGKLS